MESQHSLGDDLDVTAPAPTESPLHGFRGHPQKDGSLGIPASLTIAISREAGARSSSIAQRIGARLGWEVYTQELLEYIAQEGSLPPGPVQSTDPGCPAMDRGPAEQADAATKS